MAISYHAGPSDDGRRRPGFAETSGAGCARLSPGLRGVPARACRRPPASPLLEQHGDGRRWPAARLERFGDAMPTCHHSTWGRARVAALGALAWRAAVERGLHVSPTSAGCGARLFVNPDVVGRADEDLPDPFGPLYRLGALGVEVVAFSSAAITLEVRPEV